MHDLHIGPLDFELDSKVVVDIFLSQNPDKPELRDFIKQCKFMFNSFRVDFSVEFCKRQVNEVARALAMATILQSHFHVWIEIYFLY